MSFVLNDLFAAARERTGGKDEGEHQYRFPDQRLWTWYEQEFKQVLSRRIKMAEISYATDQAISIGTAKLALGANDYRLTQVSLVGSDGITLSPLPITTGPLIEAEGKSLGDTGEPDRVYVFSLGATVYLGLYPVPDAAVTLRIKGVGTFASEFTYDTTDDRWETTGTPGGVAAFDATSKMLAARTTAVIPTQFFVSCSCFLAWKMVESMEEYVDRPAVVQMAERRFQNQFIMDLGAFNMAAGPVKIATRGITRRVTTATSITSDTG